MELVDASLNAKSQSPFKFLDYYGEEDAELLGGRDRDIAEVISLLSGRPTLVLFGPSGSGKTSLLLAGVFPRLRSRDWHPVYVRTLIDPCSDLDRAIITQLGSDADDEEADSVLASASARSPVVIVLDQFEEFFLRFRERRDLRSSFVQRIAALLDNERIDCRIVFSLREDFLAELEGLRRFLPAVMDNRFRVQNLSAYGAREAIVRPLRIANFPADNRLLSKLVDLLAEFNFDPVILQIICVEVLRAATEREPDNLRLTISDLDAVGGIEGIFNGYLNRLEELLPEEDDQILARIVLDALITQARTKRAMRLADFAQGAFRVSEERVEEMLDTLGAQKLVRKEDRGGTPWYELIHERLAQIVHDWIRLNEKFFELVTLREIIANNSAARLWQKQPDVLLNKGVIKGLLARYQEWLRFDALQTEYVLWSVIYRQNQLFLYWRTQFGGEKTDGLLRQLLRCDLAKLRCGAAVSVGQIDNPARELVDACVQRTLLDDDEHVRRAAACALAAVASDQDLQAVVKALGDARTRQRAIAAIAEMRIAGRSVRTSHLFDRVRVKRLAIKRRLKGTLEFRAERARLGWFSGVVSGVGWAFMVGLPYLFVIDTVFVHDISTTAFMGIGFLLLSILSVILGFLFGFSMPRTHARNIVLGHGDRWWRTVVVNPVFLAIPLLLVCFLLLLMLPDFDAELVWLLSPVILMFGIFWVLIPGSVGLARTCLPQAYSHLQSAFWTFVTCLVVPLSVGWLCVVVGPDLWIEEEMRAVLVATCTALMFLSSLTTAIVVGALSTSELRVRKLSKDGIDV